MLRLTVPFSEEDTSFDSKVGSSKKRRPLHLPAQQIQTHVVEQEQWAYCVFSGHPQGLLSVSQPPTQQGIKSFPRQKEKQNKGRSGIVYPQIHVPQKWNPCRTKKVLTSSHLTSSHLQAEHPTRTALRRSAPRNRGTARHRSWDRSMTTCCTCHEGSATVTRKSCSPALTVQ